MATLLTNSLSQSKQEITKYHGTQHRKEKHRDYMTITKIDIRVVENNECHKQYGIVCLNNYNRNCHLEFQVLFPV